MTIPGENVGFRYLFFLKNLHVNQPSSGSPVYTIVLPAGLAQDALEVNFGKIGIILPENYNKSELIKSCSGQNSNLTDPLFGYTN